MCSMYADVTGRGVVMCRVVGRSPQTTHEGGDGGVRPRGI